MSRSTGRKSAVSTPHNVAHSDLATARPLSDTLCSRRKVMNIESLAKPLEPWMQVSTWHTTHPLDNERFYKALSNAFKEHGCQISYDEFKEAMEYLFEKHYSDMNIESFESKIERYAGNAENIASYICDTQ